MNDGVLYDCFLLDVGQHEHIAKRDIRLLPNNLTSLSSYTTTRLTLQSQTDEVRSAIVNKPSKKLPKEVGVRAFDVTLPPPGIMNPELKDIVIHNVSESSSARTAIAPLYSSIISSQFAGLPTLIETPAGPDTIVKKYKPKFSRLDLKFSPIRYASVIISKALHPRAVYVRIDDDEVPLFRRMMNELQQEFGTATPGSDSFCSSPLIGSYFNSIHFIQLFLISS